MKTQECLSYHIGGAEELVPKKSHIIPLIRRQEVGRGSGAEVGGVSGTQQAPSQLQKQKINV